MAKGGMPQFFGDMGSEGHKDYQQLFEDEAAVALLLRQLVDAYHEGGHGCVEGETFDIAGDFLDKLMQTAHIVGSRLRIVYETLVAFVEETPELPDEAVYAVNAVGVPGFGLVKRAEEHLVQAQCVGAVALYDVVGVYHIVICLGHLLYGPATLVLACIVEDELRVGIFGTPFAEGLGVEDVVMDDVDVYVNLRRVVVVLEVCRHKSIGVFDAVDEV